MTYEQRKLILDYLQAQMNVASYLHGLIRDDTPFNLAKVMVRNEVKALKYNKDNYQKAANRFIHQCERFINDEELPY